MKKLLLLFSLCLCSLTSFSQTTVQGHKDGFNCVVAVSTATGLTAACSAIAGNRAMYITDIEFGSSAAAATFSADTFPTLKYGTGSTCGTGTTVFWQAMIGATGQVTPIWLRQSKSQRAMMSAGSCPPPAQRHFRFMASMEIQSDGGRN
jgi:hypothetical protein